MPAEAGLVLKAAAALEGEVNASDAVPLEGSRESGGG